MADIETVRHVISRLGAILDDADPETRRKIPDRTLSAYIRDLDVAFGARLESGDLVDVHEIPPDDRRTAHLRLTLSSDDLVELVEGRLHFGSGWAHGRIKVEARFRDVLELRRFL
ncbi:MAG: hypothetical protein M0Z98_09140 [Actinomycetales bacterium]|nr:hypothetical protein [Actinomycetales bacterium]